MKDTLAKNILIIILMVNTILAFYVVFHRPRSIATTWAWLIVLLVLPVIGMMIYAFFGRGLAEENLFAINNQEHIGLNRVRKLITENTYSGKESDTSDKGKSLIDYFDSDKESPLSKDNTVDIFTDGAAHFAALFEDIRLAKETVNVEYYSFYDDKIGNELLSLLEKKATEGVKVRVLYDPWGSSGAHTSWFKPLIKLGGEVLPFVTSRDMIRKYRLNYHLHRKMVVVDGRIGWTGGFNVGDQYLGRKKKFGYWRDTHVRIVGSATLVLQERFIMDWNASIENPSQEMVFEERYFPKAANINAGIATQIVSDGPDNNEEYMKNGAMKMMQMAKNKLYIQTPYLVPDDSMIATLIIAARSGVDVKIMIPSKPDHPFIYRATQSYANYLTHFGVKIYIYNNGFLHAKTIMVDDRYSSVGSMNQDFRSYMLNFEANAFFYDRDITLQLEDIFERDMKQSTLLTQEMIDGQSRWLRFKQLISRLLSPIL